MNTKITGEEYRDAYGYVWALWWVKRAVLDADKGMTHFTLMNHPIGVVHPFELSMAGITLLAFPFSLLLSPVATYNIQVLLALIFSGLTMFWLCVDLTGDHRAGLVGGLIFTIFPNKMGHVLGGHLPQISMQWFPLYVLCLRRAIRDPGWKTTLATVLVLIPASLIHVMHLAYFLLPLTLSVLASGWMEFGKAFFNRHRISWLLAVFLLSFVCVVPFLLPTVQLSLGEDTYLLAKGAVDFATDLLAFFTPSPYHPVLRSLGWLPSFAEEVFPDRRSLWEGLAYPGVLAVGLALCGAMRRRREGLVWGALAFVSAVLSLGPLLRVGGELVLYRVDVYQSHVVLPYALLKAMPMLQIGRTPGRLNGTMMFALSILAALGMAHLLSRTIRHPWRASFLLGAVLVGVVFEYLIVWPFPAGTAKIPPSIQRIAEEPGDGALLHVPMARRRVNHRALYYQTFLPRPIVGGIRHRTPPEVPPWSETILGLAQPDPAPSDVVPRPDPVQRIAWLRHFDVDYVIFHHLTFEKLPQGIDLLYLDFIQTLLGSPKYQDDSVAVFPVPDEATTPDVPLLYTFSRRGWHCPELDGDRWRRWMEKEGNLYIYSTHRMTGSLQFAVDSHLDFPILEVYLGDRLLDSFIVGDRITYTTRPLTLTQGMNNFRFYAPGGCPAILDDPHCWADALLSPPSECARPICDLQTVRTTCRTFVFDQIRFLPWEDQSPGVSTDINFGDQLRLRGWRVGTTTLRPGDTLTVTLTWQALVPLDDRYVIFVHLLTADNTLITQDDTPPVGHFLPAWPPGTTFGYPVILHLPDDTPPGDYRLRVGVYLWPSLERLPVRADVPGAEVSVVELGHVRVAP